MMKLFPALKRVLKSKEVADLNKRYLTFFVLTNDASRTRQLKVPFGIFKAAGVSAFLSFMILAFIVFDYARLKTDSYSLYHLQKENVSQRIELQDFAAKIKELESQVARLNVFDKKLRIIANIEEPKGAPKDQLMGMGGDSTTDEELLSSPAEKKDELILKMRAEMQQLESRAKYQETSFTQLQEQLMKQASFLASTPSIWPARGWVTSTFGERTSPFTGFPQLHKGMDIANRAGSPVVASADGIIVQAGTDTGLGRLVVISHGYGIKTTYGHLSESFVHIGQKVKRGTKIGSIGNTGRSTGPHLHYEVSLNGVSVNPAKYILN